MFGTNVKSIGAGRKLLVNVLPALNYTVGGTTGFSCKFNLGWPTKKVCSKLNLLLRALSFALPAAHDPGCAQN